MLRYVYVRIPYKKRNISVPKMAVPGPVLVDPTSPAGYSGDLARSEEEKKLLKKIREEKERLWCEIQVGNRVGLEASV